ncbi:MAG: transcriptional regulator [Treponema sp.]|nr:transcriptional regulator [Treponema sp.]
MQPKEKIVLMHRISQIDDIIRRGTYPSASQIAKELEVSLRTINRDLDVIRGYYHAPLEYDQIRRGWYYKDPNFFIKYIQIEEGELFSLALLDTLLMQYKNTPLEGKLKSVFEKIRNSLPSEVSIDSRFLDENLTYIPDALAPIKEEVFDAVFSGVKIKTTLFFEYKPLQKTTFMERKIDPYHIICQRGNWYVIGFCHLKQEVRIFSFSRMQNVQLAKEHFEVPEDFNAKDYVDKTMGVWLSAKTKYNVKLQFSSEIGTFAAEHIWHEGQTVVQNEDGSVIVSFETTQLPEVKRLVLGQGRTVKVLEPIELISSVKEEIQAIKEMY